MLLWLWCRPAAVALTWPPSLGTFTCCKLEPKKQKKKEKQIFIKAFYVLEDTSVPERHLSVRVHICWIFWVVLFCHTKCQARPRGLFWSGVLALPVWSCIVSSLRQLLRTLESVRAGVSGAVGSIEPFSADPPNDTLKGSCSSVSCQATLHRVTAWGWQLSRWRPSAQVSVQLPHEQAQIPVVILHSVRGRTLTSESG